MTEWSGGTAEPGLHARTVTRAGVDLHVVEAGEGFPVVLSHGFPDLAYTWRRQLPVLAAAGYRVLAPDQRGYGRSGCPDPVEAYDIEQLTDDLICLVDDLGEERAVFVGHNWGALVVWALAQMAPDRVAAVAGLGIPMLPRGSMVPTSMMRQFAGDQWFYLLYVQEPDLPEADLGADVRTTMRRMLTGLRTDTLIAPRTLGDHRGIVDRLDDVDVLPAWLPADELDHYVEEFTRTGFTGSLNWYRNFDRNWALTPHLAGATIDVPSLYIAGSDDPMQALQPPTMMEPWLSDHRGTVLVDGASHWVHQEKPDEVNAALLAFLAEVTPARSG